MPLATRLGEVWLLGLLIIPLLYLTDKKRFLRNIAILLVVLLATGVIGRILKHVIDRPRPLKDMAGLIEAHQAIIHVLGNPLREYSFPSGHTLSVFSAATFLSFLFKKYSPLFFSLALLTGISRVYVGAHFPLDVLGGAAIGILVTWLICYVVRKYDPKYEPVKTKPSSSH